MMVLIWRKKDSVFPNLFDTWVFSNIVHFFNDFWQDTTGKIFIITILAYSSSYMLYSGYISRFAGGYGGLLLSHFGFTVLDFLALIPTVLILLVESAVSLFGFILRNTFFHIFLPITALLITVSSFNKFDIPTLSSNFQIVGVIMWIVPTVISTVSYYYKFYSNNRTAFVITSILGMVLVGISTPYQNFSENTTDIPFFTNGESFAERFTAEGLAVVMIVFIVALPSLIGLSLATTAIKNKTLSKVERIITKQPLDFPNTDPKLIDGSLVKSNQYKKHWLFNKEIPVQFGLEAFSYSWKHKEYPLLIASFSRTTAFYFISKSPLEQNKMILVSNDLIYSLELQSKTELEEITKG